MTTAIKTAQLKLGGAATLLDYAAQQAAVAYATREAGAVLLIEAPLLTSAAWALARAAAPGRHDLLQYLLAAAEMHRDGRSGLAALYECKAPNGQGRAYPIFSAARFPKHVQLLLYGFTHTEYDIVGCHLAIFLYTATALGYLHEVNTIAGARTLMRHETGLNEEFAKQATRLFATTDTTGLRKFVLEHNGIWTPPINAFSKKIQAAKPAVLQRLNQMGFLGNELQIGPQNSMYYALEAVEGMVMRIWLGKIMARCGMVSCILRGDGIWISSSTPESTIRQAFAEATAQAGFPDLAVRSADLSAYAAEASAPTPDNFRRNAQDGLWAPDPPGPLAAGHDGAPRPPFMDWLDYARHPAPPRWPADSA